jgi:CheY-like chemotaxis protein
VTSEKTILVVEDDIDCLTAITGLLQVMGYHVIGARNGLEALSILQTGLRPRVILLDLMMPLMNGWHFIEAADKNANGTLREGGVVDILTKPASIGDLQSKLSPFFAG